MQVKFLMATTHPIPPGLSPSQAWPKQKTCNINILREKMLQVISVYLRITVKEEPSHPPEMFPQQVATTHVSKSYVPKPPRFLPFPGPRACAILCSRPRHTSDQEHTVGSGRAEPGPLPERQEDFKADKWLIGGPLLRGHFYLLFPGKYFQHIHKHISLAMWTECVCWESACCFFCPVLCSR